MKKTDTKSILTSTVDITTYCDKCQLFIDKGIYRIHAKAHNNDNFATMNEEMEEKIHCEICNDFIISDLYDSHVEKHEQNNNKVIGDEESNNNEVNVVENKKNIDVENCCILKTYCDPCEKRVHTCDFVLHLNSKSHKINVSLKSKMKILPDTGIHHHYDIEHNGEISKVICRICKEEINNENVPGHVNSINHTTKYAEKLRRNEMIVNDTTLYCGLCKMNLRCENDLDHIVLDRHREKRINAAIGRATDVADKPVYCFKCEVIVRYQNSALHEHVHKNILNTNVATDKTKLTEKATDEPNNKSKKNTKGDSHGNEIIVSNNACVLRTNCVPCSRRIHTCEFGEHLESVGHKYNVGRINTDVEIPPPDPEVLNLHDHIKQVFTPIIKFQKDVHCKICNITMCKDNTKIKLIIAHVKSAHHLTKYSDLIKKNEIKEDGYASFCTRCEVEIHSQKVVDHIESEEHISNMKLTYCCVCCQVSVTNTLESKQEHELSMNHKICKKFLQLAKVFTEKLCSFYYDNTDDLELLTCKVCDTNVLTDNAQKHLATVYHILKLNTIIKEHDLIIKDSDSFYCNKCQVKIEEHCVFIHIKDAKHTSKKPDTITDDIYVWCKLCEKKIFNHPDAITAHQLSSSHQRRVNNELEINWLMAKTASDEDMVCQACFVVVPVKHVENHVEEESHKKNRRRRGLLPTPVV